MRTTICPLVKSIPKTDSKNHVGPALAALVSSSLVAAFFLGVIAVQKVTPIESDSTRLQVQIQSLKSEMSPAPAAITLAPASQPAQLVAVVKHEF